MHCVDAAAQTDDTTVSGRLCAEIEEWKLRTLEAEGSAMESRKALKLAVANMEYVGELTYRAGNILRRCLSEMDAHRMECPLHVGIYISRRGRKLHKSPHCSSLEGRDPRNVDQYDPCALCSTCILPPDSVNVSGNSSLRMAINTWLEAGNLHSSGALCILSSRVSEQPKFFSLCKLNAVHLTRLRFRSSLDRDVTTSRRVGTALKRATRRGAFERCGSFVFG